MKKIWLVAASCIFLVSFVSACSTNENLAKQKEQAEASKNLGEAYLRQGNYTAALKELLKAEKLSPDDYYVQNDLGLAYYYKGQSDQAVPYFKKALAIKDDYAPARNNLGNAYAEMKEWDKAIEQYKIVTSDLLYATPQFPYSNLGVVYFHKKEYRLSEKYFLQALKIAPKFDRALYGLSQTYIATGRISEAVEKLEKAVEVSPDSAGIRFELAKAYILKRDYRRAYGAFIMVVQLDPDSPLADAALQEAERIKPLL